MKQNRKKNQIWKNFLNQSEVFEKIFSSAKSIDDPLYESFLIKNLILFFSDQKFESINNLTKSFYRENIKDFIFDFYLMILKNATSQNKKSTNPQSNLIFGLGTGRSGSTSLHSLFSRQLNTFSSHEHPPLVKWQNDNKSVHFHLNRSLILFNSFNFIADVSHWWLSYVEIIIKRFPNSKFVCIQRDKKETINSFLKIKGNEKRGSLNHWMIHDGNYWRLNRWDKTYPKFKTTSLKDALEKYWEFYYLESEKLQHKFSSNFRIFNIKMLSSKEGQLKILEFCKFQNPKTNSILKKNINTIKDGEFGWKDIQKLI